MGSSVSLASEALNHTPGVGFRHSVLEIGVYLGAHNPLDVAGGAAIGLAIAAVLDLILDVARDRGAARQGSATRRGWIGPPVGVSRGKS